MPGATLDSAEVCKAIGCARRTFQLWRKAGKFPVPDRIEGRSPSWSRPTVDSFLASRLPPGLKAADVAPGGPPEFEDSTEGDSRTIKFKSDVEIRTEADALAYAGVDASRWYVHRMRITAGQTPMRLRKGQDQDGRNLADEPIVVSSWWIALELRLILPRPLLDAAESIFARMAAHAPKFPAIVRRPVEDPHLLEINIFDAHFGKLAWAPESGEDYDLKLAEKVYADAVIDLAAKAKGYAIDRVLLPVGNDLMHVDSAESATTRGTRVDSDGRYAKIFVAAQMAVVRAVETLRAIAPVDVIFVPGNHDRLSAFTLVRTIDAWFRNCDDVTVDSGPNPRKYFRYGNCLIGLTHGDRESPRDLPNIMAVERPKDWSETVCREWRLGHIHRSRVRESAGVETFQGVAVRWVPSLSGTDAWHHSHGYIGTRRAAEAYLMNAREGFAAMFVSYVRR
jgi:predicted DNA-binding transcriptional regulator AlpA